MNNENQLSTPKGIVINTIYNYALM